MLLFENLCFYQLCLPSKMPGHTPGSPLLELSCRGQWRFVVGKVTAGLACCTVHTLSCCKYHLYGLEVLRVGVIRSPPPLQQCNRSGICLRGLWWSPPYSWHPPDIYSADYRCTVIGTMAADVAFMQPPSMSCIAARYLVCTDTGCGAYYGVRRGN